MENSENPYFNELLSELLKTEPNLNRFKRESIPKKHKTKAYRHSFVHPSGDAAADLKKYHPKSDEKTDNKKDLIQPTDGDSYDQDNFQEFAIDENQGFNTIPLKMKPEEYSQGLGGEDYEIGGTDSLNSMGEKGQSSQLSGYSGMDEYQSQMDPGYVVEEPVKEKYYFPLKDNTGQMLEKSGSEALESGSLMYGQSKQQSGQSQFNADDSATQGWTDQDFISLGQHRNQQKISQDEKSAGKYPISSLNYMKAQSYGYDKPKMQTNSQNYNKQGFKPSFKGSFNQQYKPRFNPAKVGSGFQNQPSYYKGTRVQSGKANYIIRQGDKSAQRKRPTGFGAKNVLAEPKANAGQEDIVEKIGQGIKKVQAQNMPEVKKIMNEMKSMAQAPDETIIEIVMDCNSCGTVCPPQCNQPKGGGGSGGGNGGKDENGGNGETNTTDAIDKHCCGNNLMRITNLCPKCAFIDTRNCPVSATDFDNHNENYHILEVGLSEPFIPEMSDVSSPVFQRIRNKIQNFILRVYHDDPYYQDTLIKDIRNAKDKAIISMVIRFTKQNNGNISPLYKAFMCKCGCETFNMDIFFKLSPANTSEIMQYCPAFCGDMDQQSCNANTMCSGCCFNLMELRKVGDTIGVASPVSMGSVGDSSGPDYSRMLQQFQMMGTGASPSMFGGDSCFGGCPKLCFPLCTPECCSQLSFGYKRSVGRYQARPLNTMRS